MSKEYDMTGTVELTFSCDCLGKLKRAEIKSLLKKTMDEYLEKLDNTTGLDEDGCSIECDFDYEELE